MEEVERAALEMIGLFTVLPKLVVFDLDYTLWPFYCECRSKHDTPSLFPHSRGILNALKHQRIDLAIASKSPTPHIATTYLDKLAIRSMFAAEEIFYTWEDKTEHFQKIHSKTGVPFNSMLYFDDDNNNIPGASKLGVTSILVRNGVNLGAFRDGLTNFSQNRDASKKNKQKKPK